MMLTVPDQEAHRQNGVGAHLPAYLSPVAVVGSRPPTSNPETLTPPLEQRHSEGRADGQSERTEMAGCAPAVTQVAADHRDAQWWEGRTTGQLLCDPDHAVALAEVSAHHSPAERIAGSTIAARLVAILRAGELQQPAA